MPTTEWARFLVAERLAAGKTQDEVFADIREQMEWRPGSRSAYINLEHGPTLGGRDPDKDEQRILSAHYGGRKPTPETQPETPLTERDELVKALREQTAAINQLVTKLDSLASTAIRAGVMDALREAGVSLGGGAS